MATYVESASQSTLTPCRYCFDCLDQYHPVKSIIHNQQYSHPCRFSELCRNIHDMPHRLQFTHTKHEVSKCQFDGHCSKITDPTHRFTYRHTDLPDLLIPCRNQKRCQNNDLEHRKKYSHGENIDQNMNIVSSSGTKPSYVNDHSSKVSATSNRDSSYRPTNKSTVLGSSKNNTASHQNIQQSSSTGSHDNENTSILRFYNKDAGNSIINDASSYDQHGNPTGRIYDLGRDGAFHEYSILIAQLYQDAQFDDAAIKVPIDALKIKGFAVKLVKSENECITELQSNRHQIAWIISTLSITNNTFISVLTKFQMSGGALFLFADNVPYICPATEFLQQKFGITLIGDYYGGKTLSFQENSHSQTGHFGHHEIFTGIEHLFEGITICHPVYPTVQSQNTLVNLATATDGSPSIGIYDPPMNSTEGRLVLDCGFTKLYINWDSAGTARYIVNASCWLLGIEKRLKSQNRN